MAGVLGGAVLALTLVVGAPSPAGAVTDGAEVIVTPGTTHALGSGGSATPYGVVLPAGASCPGDTAHDGYHVFSYLVPQGTSVDGVSFRTGTPSKGYGYISAGTYVGAINTAESTGQIVGLPTSLVWTRLTPKLLFPDGGHSATWNGGIACADTHGAVTSTWNSTLAFTADSSDPGGFTWKVVDQGTVSTPLPLGLWIGIGLLVIAAAAGAYALRLRRRAHSEGPTSEGEGAGSDVPPTVDPSLSGSGPVPSATAHEAVSR